MCATTEGGIGAMGVLVGLVGWRLAVVRWVVVPCNVGGPSRLVNVLELKVVLLELLGG